MSGILGLTVSWDVGCRGTEHLGSIILNAKYKQVGLPLLSHIPTDSCLEKLLWWLLTRVGNNTHATLYNKDGCAGGWGLIVKVLRANAALQT